VPPTQSAKCLNSIFMHSLSRLGTMARNASPLPREINVNFLLSYIETGLALLEVARMLRNSEDAARCRTAARQSHDTILDLLSSVPLESSDRAVVEKGLHSLKRHLNSCRPQKAPRLN